MGTPIPRFVRWTVVLAVVAALVVAVVQYWDTVARTSAGTTGAGDITQTPWGPIGPTDRDLLGKVRQAGLWEMPTGQQAEQQGSSSRVREVGAMISAEHADLDARVRDTAGRLGVLLPSQPSAQQQGWMTEIAGRTGSDFDRTFVQRLRAAHGTVLPVLSQVRAGTRNELVRQFAITATVFVNRHMEYLESTGLVDFAALPEPPAPKPSPPATPAPAAAPPPVAPVPPAPPPAPAAVPPASSATGYAAGPNGSGSFGSDSNGSDSNGSDSNGRGSNGTGRGGLSSGAGPTDHSHHVNPVVPAPPPVSNTPVTNTASSANGANVIIAALVYIAALLAIVGLLTLLGAAGLRARRTRRRVEPAHTRRRRAPQRAVTAHRIVAPRPRHAAQRW